MVGAQGTGTLLTLGREVVFIAGEPSDYKGSGPLGRLPGGLRRWWEEGPGRTSQ